MPDEPRDPMISEEMVAHMAGAHAPSDGKHSHPHAAYGAQGDDATHEHDHTHAGDASHDHHAVETAAGDPALPTPLGMLSFIGSATIGAETPDTVALVAASMAELGSRWGIAQNDEGFHVLTADASIVWSAESYAEAVARIAEELAAETDARPVMAETWRSDMAYENVPTGDGRFIRGGAIEYRDCPLPLMLQTVTEGGHMGAVLSGAILATGKMGTTAIGSGTFDDSAAGRQFVDIIEARGRFGVSIDVAEAEGEFVCTEHDEMGECTDGQMEFSLIRVMGLTGTPFPAFEDAFIELEAQSAAVAASAEQNHPGSGVAMHAIEAPADGSWSPVLLAGGGPARPPGSWFEVDFENDPTMADYLVRQPDGQMLCPLTVTPEGRVFGHFAGWETCHTAYAATCVVPPHSRTGYAAFHLRPLETAEGDIIQVGHISMGCGHIPDDGTVPIETVRAFYDGGPGAVLMVRTRVGEDRYGGWFAGALAEEVTDEQVRRFSSLSVSGHWREVWRGKGLDLLACVAGVIVPGFPVSAMAAAGYVPIEVEEGYRLPAPHAAFADGRVVSLVAAGVVRQPQPWERLIATQQRQLDAYAERLEAVERVMRPLRGLAAERIRDELLPASGA